MEIKLHSPVGAEPVSFIWSGPDKGSDIVETIRLVGEDLPCLKNALENNLLKNVDTDSYDDVKRLCDKYNKTIDRSVQLRTWFANIYYSNGVIEAVKHLVIDLSRNVIGFFDI